jgi:hypothetical protein
MIRFPRLRLEALSMTISRWRKEIHLDPVYARRLPADMFDAEFQY